MHTDQQRGQEVKPVVWQCMAGKEKTYTAAPCTAAAPWAFSETRLLPVTS